MKVAAWFAVIPGLVLMLGAARANAGPSLQETVAKSNQLTHFELHQCRDKSCLRFGGDRAQVSIRGDLLTANDIKVWLGKSDPRQGARFASAPRFECASLTFDLKTQLLVCDNEEKGLSSYTVDASHVVRRHSPLL